ncbi:hypothetical protein [Paenibacillus campi]|uniref:hypothetical protein n=1 Tax=Paenibacillus campi TaxID=3106031 RepID=UPI002AFE73E5|nr:hypothetical protein [Paenibacillus sp. SGZ-1009]
MTMLTPEERLFQAIGHVDDVLLERLEQQLQPTAPSSIAPLIDLRTKRAQRRRWVGITAGLVAIAIACTLILSTIWQSVPAVPAIYTASAPIVNSYVSNQKLPADVKPALQIPPNGKVIYSRDVQQALQAYAGKHVLLFVAIDLFQHGAPLASDSQQTDAELKRLQQLGYSIGYARYWTYAGEGDAQQVKHIYVAAYVTAAQLKQFAASPDYGYLLHFAVNGDGSPVSGKQGIFTNRNDPTLQ